MTRVPASLVLGVVALIFVLYFNAIAVRRPWRRASRSDADVFDENEFEDSRFIVAGSDEIRTYGRCPLMDGVGRYPVFESSPVTIIAALPMFLEAYERLDMLSTIDMNTLSLEHAFAWWYIVSQLDPLFIIISGPMNGLGRALARSASPTSRIVILDPTQINPSGRPFEDFVEINWKQQLNGVDRNKVLVFFNDDQSNFRRIKEAYSLGFRHVIFGKNGDLSSFRNYDIKAVCDQNPTQRWKGYTFDHGGRTKRLVTWETHLQNGAYFQHIAETYYEFPPLVRSSLLKRVYYNPSRAPEPIFSTRLAAQQAGLLGKYETRLGHYHHFLYVYLSSRNPELEETANSPGGSPQEPPQVAKPAPESNQTVQTSKTSVLLPPLQVNISKDHGESDANEKPDAMQSLVQHDGHTNQSTNPSADHANMNTTDDSLAKSMNETR
eukprot:CAMPEP_0184683162 /NCGR_PEP_ID=MMETSP0312-20130426/10114_1 /TAXON_ID=31354 /ORGANISM="Compsopogon coeruleus, Strain SAG 36.94" /LENGTH=436 /DNA_ID=CAMNT_0027135277 /DNA_START=195 /DNA_END=1505 /DNA_ORIENTATION=-